MARKTAIVLIPFLSILLSVSGMLRNKVHRLLGGNLC